jgi:hypothetical protein
VKYEARQSLIIIVSTKQHKTNPADTVDGIGTQNHSANLSQLKLGVQVSL